MPSPVRIIIGEKAKTTRRQFLCLGRKSSPARGGVVDAGRWHVDYNTQNSWTDM